MTRKPSRGTGRSAFTLVELLIVIAIIALLVSLAASAVMRVLILVPEVQTRTDISQMESALAAFMSDYNLSDPPPSYLVLREDLAYNVTNPVEAQSLNFLQKTFGRNLGSAGPIDWNGNGALDGPHFLEGEQCLVFYLGGIPSGNVVGGAPACLGFSTNAANPAMAGGNRRGPYMQFQPSRLALGSAVTPTFKGSPWFFVYIDGWNAKPTPMPYVYYSSSGLNNQYNPFTASLGGDCLSIDPTPFPPWSGIGGPYYLNANPSTGLVNYVNPNKYQIISAGKNAQFGGGLWGGGAAAMAGGADDQANFSARLLGADSQ